MPSFPETVATPPGSEERKEREREREKERERIRGSTKKERETARLYPNT